MRLACDPFIGEHDFSSFCRRPKRPDGEPPATLVRRVTSARWDDVGDVPGRLLRFEIVANAFCHQMVRSIVGTLVEVGLGPALRGLDPRHAAGSEPVHRGPARAPPHGLCSARSDTEPRGERAKPSPSPVCRGADRPVSLLGSPEGSPDAHVLPQSQ